MFLLTGHPEEDRMTTTIFTALADAIRFEAIFQKLGTRVFMFDTKANRRFAVSVADRVQAKHFPNS
jgi:hypothetical protein